jgi:protein TIF31
VTPQSLIQDIRTHIIDTLEGSFYTCFHLSFEGKKLEDETDLGSIEGFTPDLALQMVEGKALCLFHFCVFR